jgi:hypothetical protein
MIVGTTILVRGVMLGTIHFLATWLNVCLCGSMDVLVDAAELPIRSDSVNSVSDGKVGHVGLRAGIEGLLA